MNIPAETLEWIRKAENDLAAAYLLVESEQVLPDQIGFFCQQAAEKYLKAFLIAAGQTPPRIHLSQFGVDFTPFFCFESLALLLLDKQQSTGYTVMRKRLRITVLNLTGRYNARIDKRHCQKSRCFPLNSFSRS